MTLSRPPIQSFSSVINGCKEDERHKIAGKYQSIIREDLEFGNLVSYVQNKNIPLLGIYRYKEAFSLKFVNRILSYFEVKPGDMLLDPFCGMGTALFGAMLNNISSVGIEKLPIAAFVAQTIPEMFTIRGGP